MYEDISFHKNHRIERQQGNKNYIHTYAMNEMNDECVKRLRYKLDRNWRIITTIFIYSIFCYRKIHEKLYKTMGGG